KVVVDFQVGDRVRILSGAFANVEGTIESMNDAAETATVLAIMFGRETPTEVSYIDLEKVKD
ncbi:MAG: transcription termination/antitermination protein NusG, partial [Erysipelotrichaceae bacterium]|nr:transcription termination/antitermination protein NusG [Erysipelotrichaceae bacterium]